MRRRAFGAGLLAAASVLALPVADSPAQNNKKDDPDRAKAKTVDSARLAPGEYAGTLASVPGTDRTFVLELQSRSAVPTGIRGGGRGRPATISYKTNVARTEVEFQAAEKVRVRTLKLPEQFDEKGNVKKYTSAQLGELRGKDSRGLPGYESSLDRLEAGMKVSVRLSAAPARPAGPKGKDGEASAEKKMQVRLIVILTEPTSGGAPTPRDKKK
ncbi:MAG: hypothetical protein U0797_22725 [Gemmataceae bacterium]